MKESLNPYAAPQMETRERGFMSMVVPSGITSAMALGLAMVIDTNERLMTIFSNPDPDSNPTVEIVVAFVLGMSPILAVAIGGYFWTAKSMSLLDGHRRSVSRSLAIGILGTMLTIGCFCAGVYSNRFIKDNVSTILPGNVVDQHYIHVLSTVVVFGLVYSVLYATVHRLIFRRSRFLVLLKILVPAIMCLFACILGPAWVQPASAKAFCTFLTLFAGYMIQANCIAWWCAEK